MEMIIVAIYDRASGAFGQPFYVNAPGQAIRSFNDAINNGQADVMNKHPDDFELFQLGTFNDNTGAITPQEPKHLALGKQIRASAGIRMTA